MRRIQGTLVLAFLALSTMFVGVLGTSFASAQQYDLKLNLQVAPTVVPADGGSYAVYVYVTDLNGNPAASPALLSISLFSSDQRIASIQPSTTIDVDKYSAQVILTSTSTPGITTITALAQGIQAGSLEVQTQIPVGFPSRLVVFALPPTLIPGGGESGQIVVQLQDAIGNPARAPQTLTVLLSSSDTNVITVPGSMILALGTTYATSSYSPTTIPGSVIITATVSGYQSGTTTVLVSGPSPTKLVMYVLAKVLPPDGLTTVPVAIALQDNNGFPALARAPVQVVLTSSDTTIASFTSTVVTVAQGSMYVMTSLLCGTSIGSVELTAQAQGLTKSVAQAFSNAFVPFSQGNMSLNLGPNVVLPDGAVYGGVATGQILLQNGSGVFPMQVPAGQQVQVYFSSSDSLYGGITSSGTILAGGSYVSADFTSTLYVGQTELTASADNFTEDQHPMFSSAPPPVKIALGLAAQVVRATGEVYPLLYVQLQDSQGNPAKAPQDVMVSLSSDNPIVGDVDPFVVIHIGTSFTTASFYSTSSPGVVNVTASATGFPSVASLVHTVEPFPSILAVYTPPGTLFNDGGTYKAYIQLLDAQGRPAKPELAVQLFLTSDNPAVASVISNALLASGSSVTAVALTIGAGSGSAAITAIAQGYASGFSFIQLVYAPLSINVSLAATGRLLVGTSYQVSVTAKSGPAPVTAATVTSRAVTGSFSPANASTDTTGRAGIQYSPLTPGSDNLTFSVYKTGFATATFSMSVGIDATYTLTVNLQDTTGAPIVGVAVNISDSNGIGHQAITDAGGNAVFAKTIWGPTLIGVTTQYQSGTTQYRFARLGNSTTSTTNVTLTSDTTVAAVYNLYYFVTVISPYGTATGSDFYLKGSTAIVSVSPKSVPSGFLTSKDFNGWSGTLTNKNATFSLIVNGPATLTAKWIDNLTALYIVIIIIIAAVASVVGLFWFIRRRRASGSEPQKEEEFK